MTQKAKLRANGPAAVNIRRYNSWSAWQWPARPAAWRNACFKIIHNHPQAEVAAAFEAPGHPAVGKPLSEVAGMAGLAGVVTDDPAQALKSADVLIDFTAPAATLKALAAAVEAGKACVIGTTGLDEAQKKELAGLAQRRRWFSPPT